MNELDLCGPLRRDVQGQSKLIVKPASLASGPVVSVLPNGPANKGILSGPILIPSMDHFQESDARDVKVLNQNLVLLSHCLKKGPVPNMEENKGDIKQYSFGAQFNKVKNSKRIREKMREVLYLGGKADGFIYPMEPKLHHDHVLSKKVSGKVLENNSSNDDYLSDWIRLTCDSLSHSDIENCNNRMLKSVLGKATEGIWNSMNRFGIINRIEGFDPIQKMAEMEQRESNENKGVKGKNNHYP